MKNYFKDKKFQLTFYNLELGIFLEDVESAILIDDAGKPGRGIIAARGSEPCPGLPFLRRNLQARNSEEDIPEDQFCVQAYYSLKSQDKQGLEREWSDNPGVSKFDRQILKFGGGEIVHKLIVLSYFDEDDVDVEEKTDEYKYVLKKTGGLELVAEFLLSSFCHEAKVVYIDVASGLEVSSDERFSSTVEVRYLDNFSLASDLRFMEKKWEVDWDPDYGSTFKQMYLCNINLKELKRFAEAVRIPYWIEESLPKEQIELLKSHIPNVLVGMAEEIAFKLFNQKLDNFADDKKHESLLNELNDVRARNKSFGKDLYGMLSHDGAPA